MRPEIFPLRVSSPYAKAAIGAGADQLGQGSLLRVHR